MRPQIVHRAVDTRNPNHAAVLGRWGRALSLLSFLGSHERHDEHTGGRLGRHHFGDAPSSKGRAASTDLEQSSTKRFLKRVKSANYRGLLVHENLVRTSLSATFLERVH